MLRFLHLSDLHFTTKSAGTQFDRDDEIRDRLLNDIDAERATGFDAILVTGDVAYHGLAKEFDRATQWFTMVRQHAKVPAEALFFVPGNHDVNRDHVKHGSIMWSAHENLRSIADENARERELQFKLDDEAYDFLHPLADYRKFAADHGGLSSTTAQELAWELEIPKPLDDGTPVVLHGLNSAFISNGGDQKANLLVSPYQFRRLAKCTHAVNVVMCHHPSSWLIDGNIVEDRFRAHAHLVLTGHEHESRCYPIGNSMRVCAGAVHPSRGEANWNPGYNVIELSIESDSPKQLVTRIFHRCWNKSDFKFEGVVKNTIHRQTLELNGVARKTLSTDSPTVYPEDETVTLDSNSAAILAAARRRLIISFFHLGIVAKYDAVIAADVWEEADDDLQGQARWARVFERAETQGKLALLWDAVAAKDPMLKDEPNPFRKP